MMEALGSTQILQRLAQSNLRGDKWFIVSGLRLTIPEESWGSILSSKMRWGRSATLKLIT